MSDRRPSLHIDVGVDADSDIYRGHQPSPTPTRTPSPVSIISSSSSSSSFLGRGTLGAIAAVVELAITRWARGNASDSMSSSSSSLRSSIATHPRSHKARARRRRSTTTLHSMQSERDIAAHISRLKAREESRQIPRKFTLYLPPTLSPRQKTAGISANDRRTRTTTSLPLLLSLLDSTLKKANRARRNIQATLSRAKHRLENQDLPTSSSTDFPFGTPALCKPKAWYLDIASPTWEDMRILGKTLHMHPLTLEDILQRDPREKLELFSKLGYYFVSFRAVDTQPIHGREKGIKEGAEVFENLARDTGPFGEANIYLVVFHDGICSFHFTDISEHTDRVRSRITLLEGVINMSSDWIAHGILDSVVDSFFPLLGEIEREVSAIEDLVMTAGGGTPFPGLVDTELPAGTQEDGYHDLNEKLPTSISESHFEKDKSSRQGHVKPRFSPPRLTLSLALRRIRRFIVVKLHSLRPKGEGSQSSTTHITLRRMARTRKLVTSLTRLLAMKSEVITQIRKRLMTSGQNLRWDDDLDVAMYMGDVQDHILTLQHSLVHYERILSQSHPTYLSQLRAGVAYTKSGTDKAIVYLTFVSMAVLCIQTFIGLFSLNVNVPSNDHSPDGSYHVFGIIVAFAVCILFTYISVVRRWWNQAKSRRRKHRVL